MKRLVSAVVEDALRDFRGTRGPAPSDEALWANFAWRFGSEKFQDLCHQARCEIETHRSILPVAEWPRVLQNILTPFWNARFPKGGAR